MILRVFRNLFDLFRNRYSPSSCQHSCLQSTKLIVVNYGPELRRQRQPCLPRAAQVHPVRLLNQVFRTLLQTLREWVKNSNRSDYEFF